MLECVGNQGATGGGFDHVDGQRQGRTQPLIEPERPVNRHGRIDPTRPRDRRHAQGDKERQTTRDGEWQPIWPGDRHGELVDADDDRRQRQTDRQDPRRRPSETAGTGVAGRPDRSACPTLAWQGPRCPPPWI